MRLSLLLIGATMFALAAPAQADWQYAKWGMSQQQLIAASGGAVTPKTEGMSFGRYGRTFGAANYRDPEGRLFQLEFAGIYGLNNIRFGIAAPPGTDCKDVLLPYLRSKYKALPGKSGGDDQRFEDGEDELSYWPFLSTCSFRRFKKGRF